jgi:hypothetical protein
MGYELHITRAADWTESEKHPISREEWDTVARRGPSLSDADTVRWVGIGDHPVFSITGSDGTEASLTWREGRVDVAGAHTAQLQRAIATMAQDLQGILVGDDGRVRPIERLGSIKVVDDPSDWRDRFPIGCRVGALIGGPAAYGGAALLGHGWAACDVGINASASSFTLLFFVLPFMWVVNSVLFGLVFAAVSGATWPRKVRGVLVALAAVVLFAWFLFAWQGTPSDSPDPRCPGGVPTWWPSWIPA